MYCFDWIDCMFGCWMIDWEIERIVNKFIDEFKVKILLDLIVWNKVWIVVKIFCELWDIRYLFLLVENNYNSRCLWNGVIKRFMNRIFWFLKEIII